ncbi:MAG TPA: type II toxin-antitoxin system PemK/MazF family toxin [Thermoanaerobaculia bacterium]|nr:type II toxin-antitoxin system PemK/MazF family toxin [Thermoanaerobaculia bacterium]
MARDLERGEIRLCSFPGPDKQRPVLVLTRGPAIRYLSRVTVAPITSTVRGAPSEVLLDLEDGMKHTCAANLHNLVTVAQDSLGPRLGQLRPERMREVCTALAFALGCDSP